MHWILISLYGLALTFILFHSIVQLHLVFHYYRSRKKENATIIPKSIPNNGYPFVTIQLPIYNELYVVDRLIDQVTLFDYPRDCFEIQVLDDSTDETVDKIAKKVTETQQKGIQIRHIRRTNRIGFKAGALEEGLKKAKGEFIAIFDADFLPDAQFLKNTIQAFTNPNIGMVQTKWAHINKDYSLLTKMQAFGLDAHFSVEQRGRNAASCFMNFNGTAGVWRKTCIVDAGGWQHDTLTEDLDLSYRAQLKGWRFKYLENVKTAAELPAEMNALKSQQYRWTKGAAETAKKNLWQVLRSQISFTQKLHASFHLLNSFVFVCIITVAILSVPLLIIKHHTHDLDLLFKIASLFVLGFFFLATYFWASTQDLELNKQKRFFYFIKSFPLFLSVSMGLSLHNAIAVMEGYIGKKTPFIRTPKLNVLQKKDHWRNNIYITRKIKPIVFVELLLALYFCFGIYLAFYYQDFGLLFFHGLLTLGFGMVSYYSFKHSLVAH